jgi:hypothetical protein
VVALAALGMSCCDKTACTHPCGVVQQQQVVTQQNQPGFVVGQPVRLECFGKQPKHPTKGAQVMEWSQVFGPHGPMINDHGSYASVDHVPTGMMVLRDPNTGWVWKKDCGNRVLLANPPQPASCPPPQTIYCPPPQQRQVIVQQPVVVYQQPVYRQQVVYERPLIYRLPIIGSWWCPPNHQQYQQHRGR